MQTRLYKAILAHLNRQKKGQLINTNDFLHKTYTYFRASKEYDAYSKVDYRSQDYKDLRQTYLAWLETIDGETLLQTGLYTEHEVMELLQYED